MLYRAVIAFITVLQIVRCDPWEETYRTAGCKGKYNKYLMAHLERVCDECYDLFKKQDVHVDCRRECFGLSTFNKCLGMVSLDDFLRKQQVMHAWTILRQNTEEAFAR